MTSVMLLSSHYCERLSPIKMIISENVNFAAQFKIFFISLKIYFALEVLNFFMKLGQSIDTAISNIFIKKYP